MKAKKKSNHDDKVNAIQNRCICYRVLIFCLNSLSPDDRFLLQLQNLHKLKSQHETIAKVVQLSSDQQLTRSVNSSRTKVASQAATPETKSTKTVAQDEARNCYELGRCDVPQPFFPNIRHHSKAPIIPQALCQAKAALKQHGVCIIQNFQGSQLEKSEKPKTAETSESTKKPEKQISTISRYKDPPCDKQSDTEMGQDVGSCCAKYILCLFNFIFFVSIKDSSRSSRTKS